MESLLKITTIPIEYELNIQSPKLEYTSDKAKLEIYNEKGGLTIDNQPAKLHVDSYDARNSICPTTMESVRQYAQKGKIAAYESAGNASEEGAILLDPNIANPLDTIISQRSQLPTGQLVLQSLQNPGPDIEWTKPDLSIQYQTDKMTFDLKVANGNFEFIPGNVELSVTQLPDVQIEYMGDPIYVPPSAADFFNHSSVDVLA